MPLHQPVVHRQGSKNTPIDTAPTHTPIHHTNTDTTTRTNANRHVAQPTRTPTSHTTSNAGVIQYAVVSTEVLFIIFEFICALTLIKFVLYTALTTFSDTQTQPITLVINIASNVVVLYYVLYRFTRRLNTSIPQFLAQLNTPRHIHVVTYTVCTAHTVGFILFFLYDTYASSAKKYLTLANWYTGAATGLDDIMQPTQLNISQIIDMIVFAPIREEIVFRAILLSYLMYKLIESNMHSADKQHRQVLSCVFCGGVFGLIHLLNLFSGSTTYSTTYCVAQILLGICVGLFYSLHLTLNNSLMELVMMHCVNNLFSSFVPLDLQFNTTTDAVLLVSLLSTFVMYAVLSGLLIKQLYDQPYKEFGTTPSKLHDV